MKEDLTFNDLPEAVSNLTKAVSEIKNLIQEHQVKPPQKDQDLPIDVNEAAKVLKLRVPTLYSKVSRNEIPYMKQGRRLYFSRHDLIEWIKEGKSMSVDEIQQQAENYLSTLKTQ